MVNPDYSSNLIEDWILTTVGLNRDPNDTVTLFLQNGDKPVSVHIVTGCKMHLFSILGVASFESESNHSNNAFAVAF